MQARVFCFFADGSSILNSIRHMWQWKEEALLCWICMHNFKSHFQWDFLAYCTRQVSVHLAMACVSCLFNSFSVFLLSLKQLQNLMKIMFSCIHFLVWPYPPQKIMKKMCFILVNWMGWQVCMMNYFALQRNRCPNETEWCLSQALFLPRRLEHVWEVTPCLNHMMNYFSLLCKGIDHQSETEYCRSFSKPIIVVQLVCVCVLWCSANFMHQLLDCL